MCIETLKIVNKKKKKGIRYEKNEIFIDVGCDSSGISVNSKVVMMILGMDLIVGVTTHTDGMATMATGAGTTITGTRAAMVETKTIAVPSWLACSVENGVVTLPTPISMRMAILVLRSLTIRP